MARLPLALLCLLTVASGESLFDDDDVAAYKQKHGEEGEQPAGESLFDDEEVAAYNAGQHDDVDPEEAAKEIAFDSKERKLTADIVFDERGNVKEGGSTDPDIAFYHVVEFNGERMYEPTDGSSKLMEAIEQSGDYEVKFAPPAFAQFQCTEKVESMEMVLGRMDHELSEEIRNRAIATLAHEGIANTKQLGELEEKDYDAIVGVPALIKSRLRKIMEEARKQAAVAEQKVELDSQEVQDELNAYMEARNASRDTLSTAEAGEATPVIAQGDPEEEDGTFKSLVWAVMNCPTCKGKETITCFRSCRYGGALEKEKGTVKPWSECLDQCIENRWLRATFYAMLPRS